MAGAPLQAKPANPGRARAAAWVWAVPVARPPLGIAVRHTQRQVATTLVLATVFVSAMPTAARAAGTRCAAERWRDLAAASAGVQAGQREHQVAVPAGPREKPVRVDRAGVWNRGTVEPVGSESACVRRIPVVSSACAATVLMRSVTALGISAAPSSFNACSRPDARGQIAFWAIVRK